MRVEGTGCIRPAPARVSRDALHYLLSSVSVSVIVSVSVSVSVSVRVSASVSASVSVSVSVRFTTCCRVQGAGFRE